MKIISAFILLLWVFPCAEAAVVNYTNALAAAQFSQPLMNRIGSTRWFMAHASTGEAILAGVEALYQTNASLYQLTRQPVGGTPPTNTQPGVIYDFMRGNPWWAAKVDGLRTYLLNGWHYPSVDIALTKLCYLDVAADPVYYATQISSFEKEFPNTLFLYVTMPLRVEPDEDNYYRNIFNDTLRAWATTNKAVILYDIADIESHAPDGAPQFFMYQGRLCQKLYSDYTVDGGHLEYSPDSAVATQNAALGLYAAAAAVLSLDRDADGIPDSWEIAHGLRPLDPLDAAADSDGDGMTNRQEYESGTDPMDAPSHLRLRVNPSVSGRPRLEFDAVPDVQYEVQFSSSMSPVSWNTISEIPAQSNAQMVSVEILPDSPGGFYRITAKRAQ